MASFQAIVIIFCLFLFGLVYAALYDPVDVVKNQIIGSRTDPQVQQTDSIMWAMWWGLPIAFLAIIAIYGVAVTQKG